MKARICLAASVCESDRFLTMGTQSQLLYLHLAFEQSIAGEIRGARRICRGLGFDGEALEELISNGYLLDLGDGSFVDTYCFTHNRLDARLRGRVDEFEPLADGRIAFESEPYRSRYVLVDDTAQIRRVDGVKCATTQSNLTPNQRQSKPTEPQSQSQDNVLNDVDRHPCMCRDCNATDAAYFTKDGFTWIDCPNCGVYQFGKAKA